MCVCVWCQNVCWLNRHAPTADLWLANCSKVPTKIISPSRARDTPRKLKKGEGRSEWVRAGVEHVGQEGEGATAAGKTGGQCTLQAASHTSTPHSDSLKTKCHNNFIWFLTKCHYARLENAHVQDGEDVLWITTSEAFLNSSTHSLKHEPLCYSG